MSAGPRHSRKEIRDFAAWLRKQGWVYESTDAKGHTLWSHPRSPKLYKLAETPRHFNVQLSRRDVLRLMGEKVEGKRRPKAARGASRSLALVDEVAPGLMRYPFRCRGCGHLHDAAKVTVEVRYRDCSAWRCPRCDLLIDDRPERYGGTPRVKAARATPVRRKASRHLPWEGADQPDGYDYGLARMMREIPGR